jgi:hypothetical protein
MSLPSFPYFCFCSVFRDGPVLSSSYEDFPTSDGIPICSITLLAFAWVAFPWRFWKHWSSIS